MADVTSCAGVQPCAKRRDLAAPLHLLAVGSLLAFVVMLSKMAAVADAPMLGFLSGVWLIAFAILALPALLQRGLGGMGRSLPYSTVAGALMVAPTAIGYLAVGHTGAGFISLTLAFPVLLTWVIARALRLDAVRKGQGAGVLAALSGGVLLAVGKLGQVQESGGAVWVLLAAGIPVALAFGNIFRSRHWPEGERPLPLAALSILMGTLAVIPFAVLTEGARLPQLWLDPRRAGLTLLGGVLVAGQYVLQFRLQEIAGPVYMSQIGGVAAVIGALVAFLALGEAVPPVFWTAALPPGRTRGCR